jgi:formylglycine-generating enzyme required for sulfatase activity
MSNDASNPAPAKTEWFKDCPTCPEMVAVPTGQFMMGSPENEPEREIWREGTESPQHKVTIGRPLAVGRFAVTRGEYAAFVQETGRAIDDKCWSYEDGKLEERSGRSFRNPGFAQDDRHPVVCVNWDDANGYAAWLSKKTGKSYRLLSEAEREYVTRAGTTTPFWWGTSITPRQANYDGSVEPYKGGGSKDEYRKHTLPVDSFEPNPWGLYQVHGNVSDWTEDCPSSNVTYQGAPTDGSARTLGNCGLRVLRGGSWRSVPQGLRSASRDWGPTDIRYSCFGFRLARTLNP